MAPGMPCSTVSPRALQRGKQRREKSHWLNPAEPRVQFGVSAGVCGFSFFSPLKVILLQLQ